jgi:hypothetical protein
MAEVRLTLEEYEALRSLIGSERESEGATIEAKKRKPSAYSKRYGKAFKKVAGKYKKKNGGWMKDGFKRAQKAAHALAKKK